MSTIMSIKELAEKLNLNNNTIRTILCRQEFTKYATYRRVENRRSGICYFIDSCFLNNLLSYMQKRLAYDQIRIIRRWINEYD